MAASRKTPCELLGGATPRHAMQTLGTEWGRQLLHPDLWIILWRSRARSTPLVVVDDVRFPNEVAAVRAEGGTIWRINRPGCVGDGHVSESYISEFEADVELHNAADLAALRAAVEGALQKWHTPAVVAFSGNDRA